MFNIGDYLKKFSKIETESKEQKDIVSIALKEICNLESVSFEIKKHTLYIKSNSLHKSIIFMKKDSLVKHLSKYPNIHISDIR